MLQNTLFDEEEFFEPLDSEPDDTEITTTLLYYSKEELKEFKVLVKEGMRREFNGEHVEKGNFSDLLLIMLRKYYGNKKEQACEGVQVEEGIN